MLFRSAELYFNFVEEKKKNPFVDALKENLSVHVVAESQAKLQRLFASRRALFDTQKYKYARQVLTYYNEVKNDINSNALIKLIAKYEYPKQENFLKTSCFVFPLYPFAKINMLRKESIVKKEVKETLQAVDEYLQDYTFLQLRACLTAIIKFYACFCGRLKIMLNLATQTEFLKTWMKIKSMCLILLMKTEALSLNLWQCLKQFCLLEFITKLLSVRRKNTAFCLPLLTLKTSEQEDRKSVV